MVPMCFWSFFFPFVYWSLEFSFPLQLEVCYPGLEFWLLFPHHFSALYPVLGPGRASYSWKWEGSTTVKLPTCQCQWLSLAYRISFSPHQAWSSALQSWERADICFSLPGPLSLWWWTLVAGRRSSPAVQ